ncbi:MAG: hypothetical protein FJ271_34550, partial [Planctomycetes bacterium]|nr:hypothetical protein [Planctomycetota bacterium]
MTANELTPACRAASVLRLITTTTGSTVMQRQFLIGCLTAVMVAAGAASAGAEAIKWKLGSALPPGHITNDAMIDYTKRVKQRSGGEIDIELVPLDAVGFKEADLLRVLKQGVMDATFFAQFYAFRDDPLLANYLPTGGLTTPDDNMKILDIQHAYATKVLKDRWNAVVVTPIFNRSGRELILVSRTPMASLADLKGKKMRHFEKTGLIAFQNLGVAAQIVAQADLYVALRTGVIDSAIHGIPNVKNQSLWETTCCFSNMVPFTGQAVLNAIVVPQKNWDRLSDKQRTVLQDVGKELWAELLQEWRDGDRTQRETFELFKQKRMK